LQATLKLLVGRSYRNFKFGLNEVKRGTTRGTTNIASIDIDFYDLGNGASALIKRGEEFRSPQTYYRQSKNYFINCSIIGFGPFKHSNFKDYRTKNFISGCHINNFVDSSIPLHDSQIFLLKLNQHQFNEVSLGMLDLLMLDGKATIERNIDQSQIWINFDEHEDTKYFKELSDGYKSILTLGCNIMEGLLRNNESIENASGLVVIDEIGANLHPRWKMQIVKRLRRTFPNVQFLVTTHDPLCLKGIEDGETYVLRNVNNQTEVLTELPNPSHLKVGQLLTSEFFGLYSTQDPETEKLFNDYYELLSRDESELPKDYQLELEILRGKIRERNHLGDTRREELLYKAIDTIIAKRKNDRDFTREKVEKEVKEAAIKMIDDFLKEL
jgi:AAA domain, putative AbiEii toxin, Type IV TA system